MKLERWKKNSHNAKAGAECIDATAIWCERIKLDQLGSTSLYISHAVSYIIVQPIIQSSSNATCRTHCIRLLLSQVSVYEFTGVDVSCEFYAKRIGCELCIAVQSDGVPAFISGQQGVNLLCRSRKP